MFYTISVEQVPTATRDFVAKPDSLRQHDVLYEWTATDPNATTFEGTSRELMRFEQSTVIHNVNDLAFAPDKTLYIDVGDDNFTFRPPNGRFSPSQDVSRVFGKILRIDPLGSNSANGQYGIPADNPFVRVEGAAEEAYAIGLRNPWRIHVDPTDGVLYAADVGELNVEDVDVIVSGGTCSWAQKEGSRLAD